MLTSTQVGRCAECSGEMLDAGDELVCRSCGVVVGKEVLDWTGERLPRVSDQGHSLGGYMGPMQPDGQERARGLPGSPSSFRYLKLVSDYSGRENSTVYSCVKMIERVCEKLSLPRIVATQATVVARKLFEVKRARTDITSGAVSAYAIITACKIEGVTSVGVKEIVEAHRVLGRRVKASALISLSLNSPVKVSARRAEDYVGRVVAHLPSNAGLAKELRSRSISETAYIHRLRGAALEALAATDDSSRGGHSPCALAATAVYAGEMILAKREVRRKFLTQKDVADCVGVAEYTVREQFGEVFRQTNPLIDGVTRPTCQTAPTTN